ncbi:MAG: DUF309 domain-containing protein [Arcobacteraceae bacterium]
MSAIKEFIALVQTNEFAPAHEVLEHDWKAYKKQDKMEHAKALQGLINGTTALALYKKGKLDGYKKVWDTFLKYQHLLDSIEIEEKALFLEARECLFQKNKIILQES